MKARLILRVEQAELDWVKHAAQLRRISLADYVRQAINASLCKEGVDAVLLQEPTYERQAMKTYPDKQIRPGKTTSSPPVVTKGGAKTKRS